MAEKAKKNTHVFSLRKVTSFHVGAERRTSNFFPPVMRRWLFGVSLRACGPRRRRKFPFRKRSLPFEAVDAISQNSRCHLKRSMPFLKLAEQTTALVNSSYAVGTLGRHFRAVLFIRWRSNPRARELSQLKQNEPILLVQKENKNQLRSQRGGTPLCSQLRWVCFVFPEIFNHFQPG